MLRPHEQAGSCVMWLTLFGRRHEIRSHYQSTTSPAGFLSKRELLLFKDLDYFVALPASRSDLDQPLTKAHGCFYLCWKPHLYSELTANHQLDVSETWIRSGHDLI